MLLEHLFNVINYTTQICSNISTFTLDFNQAFIEENPLNLCTDLSRRVSLFH